VGGGAVQCRSGHDPHLHLDRGSEHVRDQIAQVAQCLIAIGEQNAVIPICPARLHASAALLHRRPHLVNPAWFTAPACIGNSKHRFLAPPAEAIALVWLKDEVAGVTPDTLCQMRRLM
jgi:hypothetical protein